MASRDERTTAVGLYHYACSYHDSARALIRVKLELFLKTILRSSGHTVDELETTFRHDFSRMRKRISALGVKLEDEDLAVMAYLEKSDLVARSRYISTGAYRSPTLTAIDETVSRLRIAARTAAQRTTEANLRP